jgi:hypothetical protein
MSGFCCFVTWCFSRQLFVLRSPSFRQTNQRIRGQRELLQGRNKKRPKKNQAIKESEQIEKYAREKYWKKDSEDIYIIEFEGDTIEKIKFHLKPLREWNEIYSNY